MTTWLERFTKESFLLSLMIQLLHGFSLGLYTVQARDLYLLANDQSFDMIIALLVLFISLVLWPITGAIFYSSAIAMGGATTLRVGDYLKLISPSYILPTVGIITRLYATELYSYSGDWPITIGYVLFYASNAFILRATHHLSMFKASMAIVVPVTLIVGASKVFQLI